VATTARHIAVGPVTATSRRSGRVVAPSTTRPSSRFQPAWKLGIAAYSFTSDRGRICRYSPRPAETVSMTARPLSLGGATGNTVKTTNPIEPVSRMALRSR
jgi:hypothetical protein